MQPYFIIIFSCKLKNKIKYSAKRAVHRHRWITGYTNTHARTHTVQLKPEQKLRRLTAETRAKKQV